MEKNSEFSNQNLSKQSRDSVKSQKEVNHRGQQIEAPYLEHLHQLDFLMNRCIKPQNSLENAFLSSGQPQQCEKNKAIGTESLQQQSLNYAHTRYITPSKYVDQLKRVSFLHGDGPQNHSNLFSPCSERSSFCPYKASTFIYPQMVNNATGLKEQRDKDTKSNYYRVKVKLMCWVRKCIQKVTNEELYTVKEYYNSFHGAGQYQNLFQILNERYSMLIENVTPSCTDFSNRKTQLFKFFIYFLSLAIHQYNKNDLYLLFKYEGNFGAFLILTANIFNFCYNAQKIGYLQYCQIFSVKLSQAYQPINWFGRCKIVPIEIQDYLFSLETSILMKDIWKTQTIDEIFNSTTPIQQQNKNYRHNKMLFRMMFRLKQRTIIEFYQIGKKIFRGEKYCRSFYPLLNFILKKKLVYFMDIGPYVLIFLTFLMGLAFEEESNKQYIFKVLREYESWLARKDDKFEGTGISQKDYNIITYYNEVFVPIISQQFEPNEADLPQKSIFVPKTLTQTHYTRLSQEKGGFCTDISPQIERQPLIQKIGDVYIEKERAGSQQISHNHQQIPKNTTETLNNKFIYQRLQQKLKKKLSPNFSLRIKNENFLQHYNNSL